MIRILSFIIACIGFAICIASSLAFLPLAVASSLPLEAVDQITSQTMTAGLALSALGGLGLLATEVVSELRTA
jgi:hypothetical protein